MFFGLGKMEILMSLIEKIIVGVFFFLTILSTVYLFILALSDTL
jgi:hypothetical protein